MADECDIDTLAAMLDDLDEEVIAQDGNFSWNNKAEDLGPCMQPAVNGGDDSSDDDIDDDELDKLTSLVEAEQVLPAVQKASAEVEKPGLHSQESQSNRGNVKKVQAAVGSPGCHKDQTHISSMDQPVACSQVSSVGSDRNLNELKVKDDIAWMKEHILRLEAQLSQQQQAAVTETTPTKLANSQTPHLQQHQSRIESKHASHTSVVQKDCKQKSPHGQSKDQSSPHSHTASHAPPRKVRDLDMDIFFADTNELQGQVKVKKEKSKFPITNGSSGFGKDSDDDDWPNMDGERTELSKEGKEINRLLNRGPRERHAHAPSYSREALEKVKSSKSLWSSSGVTPVPKHQSSHGDGVKQFYSEQSSSIYKKAQPDDPKIYTDSFSKIRIVKPLLSRSLMKQRMEGRKMIKMSSINKCSKADLDGDWVTIGVVVSKTEPKMSSKGNQYSIWKLSDLDDCDCVVSFFLFGDIHKQLWKTVQGSVIGLLNPTRMQNADRGKSDEMSLTINSQLQLLLMGQSKDLGRCRATTKAGKPCNNFINTQQGEHCTYHIQAAYKKLSAKRPEIQASFSSSEPRGLQRKIFGKGSTSIMYGGQAYSTTVTSSKTKNQVSLSTLQQHQVGSKSKGKVTTMGLHKLLPEDEETLKRMQSEGQNKKKVVTEETQAFHNMLSIPSVGSMNLVKHLLKKDQRQVVKDSKSKSTPVQSISAKDLLKQHTAEMKAKMQKRKSESSLPSMTEQPEAVPQNAAPKLGRGFYPGQDIFFDAVSPKSLAARRSDPQLAKQRAIAKVMSKGGLEKEDPNAVRKRSIDPDSQETVKKRVLESIQNSEKVSSSEDEQKEPPKKKSRLIGDLDLDDPEVKKMLKARSKHSGALNDEEWERQAEYFSILEKKEQMEDKMNSITEVKVTAFTCKECGYTAQKASDKCRAENHNIKAHQAIKRFFKCVECKNRTISLQRYPVEACQKCNGTKWKRASMYQERKGPKLIQDQFKDQLRGEECKYLNSLQ